MENTKRLKWTFALLCTLALSLPVMAHEDDSTSATSTQISRPADTNMDDDVRDVNEIDSDEADSWSATTEPGDQDINVNVENQPATVAPAAGESRADADDLPRSMPSVVRIIPTAGAASFTSGNDLDLDNFDDGFTAGLLVDIGSADFVFETGVLALNADAQTDDASDSASLDVDSWGIPLLGKWNMSGKPHETVYLKLGAMPFQPSGASDDFDVLGVAGLGGAIPLFRNTSLTLEASYNRLFEDGGDLGTYQGVAVLGGLQIGL